MRAIISFIFTIFFSLTVSADVIRSIDNKSNISATRLPKISVVTKCVKHKLLAITIVNHGSSISTNTIQLMENKGKHLLAIEC